jgi:hypothetical protein
LVEDCTTISPGYFPGPKKVKAVKPAIEIDQHFYLLNKWLKKTNALKKQKTADFVLRFTRGSMQSWTHLR